MSDFYINSVKKTFPKADIIDYVITLKETEGLGRFIPFYNIPEQLIIFLTSANEILVMKVKKSGKLLPPEILQNARIQQLPSLLWPKIQISNSPGYEGSYSVIRKYRKGKCRNKGEFIELLVRG